jgi:pyrimidine operon attenuation protein/uracil phosphoribosyltransferase
VKYKARLMEEEAVRRALTRLSYEILEKSSDMSRVVLVGIRTRGVPLAKYIAENIRRNASVTVPVAELDITLYRDDVTAVADSPLVKSVDIPFDIGGKEVVLVDDVLYTGRTTRAAIDALFSVGRPDKIRLAVLIDRGHRELPIRPDYVGKNVPTSHKEAIRVNLEPTDGKTDVELYEREEEE